LDTLLPDFLPKEIRQLDLSFNRLNYLYNQPDDTLARFFLPPTLSKLDLSHNQLSDFFMMRNKEEGPSLSELNLSYNRLIYIGISLQIRKIDASNNDLLNIGIYHENNLKYVNVSDNPRLSNRVNFDPSKVDTLIRHNIANDKPLEDVTGFVPKLGGPPAPRNPVDTVGFYL
jgi:Leucine-rich repeat (LRR) protein